MKGYELLIVTFYLTHNTHGNQPIPMIPRKSIEVVRFRPFKDGTYSNNYNIIIHLEVQTFFCNLYIRIEEERGWNLEGHKFIHNECMCVVLGTYDVCIHFQKKKGDLDWFQRPHDLFASEKLE